MSRLHYARKRLQQLLKDVWRGTPADEGVADMNTVKIVPSGMTW